MPEPIRVVIDTNEFISGTISDKGKPARLLQLWKEGKIFLVICDEIIDEIIDVLNRDYIKDRYNIAEVKINLLISLFYEHDKALIVEDIPLINDIKEDPQDNKFIACALKGNARYIITGDKHFKEQYYQGIEVISVSDFLEKF